MTLRLVRTLALLAAPLLAGAAAAEVVVFSATFGSPAGEECDPALPAGWSRIDADGGTPHEDVAWVDAAWVVGEDPFDPANCAAASTSWYVPAGAADDWLITPLLHVPAGAVLRWRALAEDPTYPDGYQVRYSLTGTAPADFLSLPALFSIADEETTWTARELDLESAGLTGRALRLAFRNDSDDDLLLYVDDVELVFEDAVFHEEFGGSDGALCAPVFPVGWTRLDVDGRTPDPAVAWVDEAWVAAGTAPDDPAECAAFSTSAYVDFGQADDWMVTPPIAVPRDAELRWRASAFTTEELLRDGYEVRWSTTGSAPADFPDGQVLFAVEAESIAWAARSVDLDEAGLGGETVRFAFRNHSTNKDLLAIDAVEVAATILFRDGFESGFAGAWSATAGLP